MSRIFRRALLKGCGASFRYRDRLYTVNVELILNKRGSNECVSIGKNKAFTMFNKSIHNLYSAIWDFAECCETYEGELDGWAFREEQRVQEAIRTGIIAYYKGGIDDGH